MQIFLARNNVQAGPYTLEELNTMLASGQVLLDDLMWHEGMPQWQRLGDVTGNQPYYTLAGTLPPFNKFINNEANRPHNGDSTSPSNSDASGSDTNNSISVDRLYGKASPAPSSPSTPASPFPKKSTPVSLNKGKAVSGTGPTDVIINGNPPVVLAPIMSRVLALAINGLLYLLSVLPMLMAYTKLDIDYTKFQSLSTMAARIDYLTPLIETIPDSTMMMSNVMLYGLLAIQLLLIIKRGQSLGKMMTGIRVVDQTTHTLPSLGARLGTRALLLTMIYVLLTMFLGPLVLIPIAIHYYMAAKSPKNIGLHDKLAKTLVVKADDNQLVK
ncbi:MAG: RDD family protein [Psychrobacter sp.]|nr:RDD family protein [Psychrobacter sp.]